MLWEWPGFWRFFLNARLRVNKKVCWSHSFHMHHGRTHVIQKEAQSNTRGAPPMHCRASWSKHCCRRKASAYAGRFELLQGNLKFPHARRVEFGIAAWRIATRRAITLPLQSRRANVEESRFTTPRMCVPLSKMSTRRSAQPSVTRQMQSVCRIWPFIACWREEIGLCPIQTLLSPFSPSAKCLSKFFTPLIDLSSCRRGNGCM